MAEGDGRRDEAATEAAETLREAVERSRSGAPAAGRVVRDRFSADEVFQRIVAAADEEITAGSRELFFSGLAAGFAITITFLLYVSLTNSTGGDPVLSALLYPLGFIYIIIGGYQLYTENTLPPVALTLERIASIPALLRNWIVVLAGNFTGGTLGAAALAWGGVLSADEATVAADLASKGIETAGPVLFAKAAFAGLIVAGVVWVEYAARDTISRLVVVYFAFLSIPIGGLFHVVVSYTEMIYLVLLGELGVLLGLRAFVVPVLLGNTLGGVVLVTVVNYFQTTEDRLESARFEGANRQLSVREWLFGGFVGRSYVPLIDTGEGRAVERGPYRIVVPIANPRTETDLVDFACTLAAGIDDAVVHAVHIVQLPTTRYQGYGAGQSQRIVDESEAQMADIRAVAETHDVAFKSSTVLSHRSFEELFNVARRREADLVVLGWGEDRVWGAGRADRPVDELAADLPCDFLVLRDRDLDTSELLLATEGGPEAELNAEVARTLQEVDGSDVSLLHVVDGPGQRDAGERFLQNWADEHGLEDAVAVVDDSGDVEKAIAREAADHTLLMVGATERGLLSRLHRESLHMDTIQDLECSVLFAERASERGPIRRAVSRLLGRS